MENDNRLEVLMKGAYQHVLKAPTERKRALTDNEKVATLIGWNPTDPCVGGILSDDGHCPHGNFGVCDQFAVAPDMMVPNNYMAAFYAVGYFTLSFERENGYYVYIEKPGPAGFIIEDNNILRALADYYDKLRR
jgi:hypothetical protein